MNFLFFIETKPWCDHQRHFNKKYIISISHSKLSINLELNATHPIQIHYTVVVKKLRFGKKVKKMLTSNISEIYGSNLLPKELTRLVYKIYRYKKFHSD